MSTDYVVMANSFICWNKWTLTASMELLLKLSIFRYIIFFDLTESINKDLWHILDFYDIDNPIKWEIIINHVQ